MSVSQPIQPLPKQLQLEHHDSEDNLSLVLPSKQQSAEQLNQKVIVQGNSSSLSNPPEMTPQIQGKSQLSTPILPDKSLHPQSSEHFAQPPNQNMDEFFRP